MSEDYYAVRFESAEDAEEVLDYIKDPAAPGYTDILKKDLGRLGLGFVNALTGSDFGYHENYLRNGEDIIPKTENGRKKLDEKLGEYEYELIG